MNLRKGFFRLTFVLSISIGIILAFLMMEREPYTRYKVKRAGEGGKELTITLLWYGSKDPDSFDFFDAFTEAEATNKRVIEDLSWLPNPSKKNPYMDIIINDDKFNITEKTANPIKWNRFFLILGKGFISIWIVYAFIRWVVIAFIIGGFRHKANS